MRQKDLQKRTKQSMVWINLEMEPKWTEKLEIYKTFFKSKSPKWISPAKKAVIELLLGSLRWIGLIFLRKEKEDLLGHMWSVAPL